MGTAAASTAPAGQEHRKAYTADEKVALLEEFLMARAAKEGDDQAICARLGVSRVAIYGWKAQLERGEELSDAQQPSQEQKAEESVAEVKKKKRRNPSPHVKTSDRYAPLATRIKAAQESLAGNATHTELARQYGVSRGTIDNWVNAYKLGKYNAPGKQPNTSGKPDQIVMFEPPQGDVVPTKKKQPVSLGRVTQVVEFDEVTQLRAALALAKQENLRLQRKLKALVGLVAEDE